MTMLAETPHNEASFCLVGTDTITSILQKTPSRVLHLVPRSSWGWEIKEEFTGENWNIRKKGSEFFVYNTFNAGWHIGWHCSHPFPAFDTSKLFQ